MRREVMVIAMLFFAALLSNCGTRKAGEETIIVRYPLDGVDGVLTASGVSYDADVSSDGAGSLKIVVAQPTIVRLFETGDIDIEDARILYKARLKTEQVKGAVYLEMWCHFPAVGEAFSRGLQSPLSGTTDWVSEEIPFFLKKGENPDNVKLNLVIDGTGTVWIDAIDLVSAPFDL